MEREIVINGPDGTEKSRTPITQKTLLVAADAIATQMAKEHIHGNSKSAKELEILYGFLIQGATKRKKSKSK